MSKRAPRLPISSKQRIGRIFSFLAGVGTADPVSICARLALLGIIGRDFILYDRWLAVDASVALLAGIVESSRHNPYSTESPETNLSDVLSRAGVCRTIYELVGIDICVDGSPVDKLVEITNKIRLGDIVLNEPIVVLLGKAVLVSVMHIVMRSPWLRGAFTLFKGEQEGVESDFGI